MANDDNQRVSTRDATVQRYRSLLENDRVQHFLRRNGLTNHGGVPLRREEVERRLRHIDERNSFDLMAQSVVEKALGIDRPTAQSSKSKTEQKSENDPYVTIYDDPCGITMSYKGSRPSNSKVRGDEVVIVQSHTEMDSTTVYKGFLHANDQFTFKSRRLIDRPFAIAIYVNGIIDSHLSICCERGLLKQFHFQLRKSSCRLVSITGGTPCDACQHNNLTRFSSSDDEETHAKDQYKPVLSVPRRSSRESVEPGKTSGKVVTKVENLVLDKPLTVVPANNEAIPAPIPGIAKEEVSKIESSTLHNEMVGPSLNKEQPTTIDKTILEKDEGKASQPNQDTIKTDETNNKQNEKGQMKISNEAAKSADISPEAESEMQKLLDKYADYFLPRASSSSTSNDTLNAHGNTQTALGTGPNSTVGQLVQPALLDAQREAKHHIQATSAPSYVSAEESVETFELIWLDASIGSNEDAVESHEKLRAIVNALRTYRSIDEAIAFIRTVPEKKVYLIISGELGKHFVKRKEMKEFSQIDSIYIFCKEPENYLDLKQGKYKVRDVFVGVDPLCDRLKKDTAQTMTNLVPISGTSDTASTNPSDGSKQQEKQVKFLCSQLNRDLLLSMEYPDDARNDLIVFCRDAYEGNPTELLFIEELKGYHTGKAIRWYTRQTFLYKMLNNALYRQDVNLMHKLHFFIKDLHVQIEQLHSYYKPSLGSRTLTVFRGLTLSMADFNAKIRREKNNLIAFDSFLSTSLSINVAKAFARDKKDPNDQSILLHIEIDADKIGRPFADISRLSEFGKEGEILFSMGTVFRVVDVAEEETSEQLWIVKLVSADDDDKLLMKEGQKTQPMLSSFFKHVYQAQKELGDHRLIAASCVNIASMCFRQRQYKSSLDLYTKSLNTLLQLASADPLTVATYQSNVARAHLALDETSEALALYEKALETRVKRCERNDPLLINTLHTIGNIYKEKKDYDKAYKVYLRALEFQTSNPTPGLQLDPSSVAATYIYMANVLYEDGHPKAALENFKKALDYQHAHLSKDHPALAFLHNNIGAMHYRNEEYKQALKHHATCLEIEKRSLPKDHITFIDTYRSMAETCERVEKRDEAVEYAQKLVDQCKLHETQAPKQLKEALELLNRLTQDRDLFKP